MATTSTELTPPPCSSTCDCCLSHLLKRAVDLIDPPRSSADLPTTQAAQTPDGVSGVNGSGTPENKIDSSTTPTESQTTSLQEPENFEAVKKVRFSESCSPPRKLVSASDAIQAYDLLMHATSFSISPQPRPRDSTQNTILNGDHGALDDINAATSWERLQNLADVYRALLVTSCLLLELLPRDISNKSIKTQHHADESTIGKSHNTNIMIPMVNQHKCPLSCDNDPPCIPALSPACEKRILSTARRCILLLQALERICAAKIIAQRYVHGSAHLHTKATTITRNNSLLPTSFYPGGDDIHDYNRSIVDLHSNYDWHDDGALPLPFSSHDGGKIDAGSQVNDCITDDGALPLPSSSPKPNNDDCNSDYYYHANKPSILQECCYRSQQSDPPSSKFEMNAWTRDWIHGERLISLRLEDYQYHDGCDANELQHGCTGEKDAEGSNNNHGGECSVDNHAENDVCKSANDDTEARTADENITKERADSNLNLTAESDILIQINKDNYSEILDWQDHNNDEEENILSLSPQVIAEEEARILNIMLPVIPNKKRSGNLKRKKKKKTKRARKTLLQHLEWQDSTIDATCQIDQKVYAKEGFLLLVYDDKPNNVLNYLNMHAKSNPHLSNNQAKAKQAIRVFVRLHPSGWLSIEDRSIRHRDCNHANDLMQQPLPQRVRYWDFFIGPETQCQPWVPEGTSSFHFKLDCVRLLGASSLSQSLDNHDKNNNGSCQSFLNNKNDSTASNKTVDLLFGVDEQTGGAFMDGFEWVNVLSGSASTATSLQENIRSEWSEGSDF